MPVVKTTVSLPEDLFRSVDRLAAQSKASRSEIIARALRSYLGQGKSDNETIEALNKFADEHIAEFPADLDRHVARLWEGLGEW